MNLTEKIVEVYSQDNVRAVKLDNDFLIVYERQQNASMGNARNTLEQQIIYDVYDLQEMDMREKRNLQSTDLQSLDERDLYGWNVKTHECGVFSSDASAFARGIQKIHHDALVSTMDAYVNTLSEKLEIQRYSFKDPSQFSNAVIFTLLSPIVAPLCFGITLAMGGFTSKGRTGNWGGIGMLLGVGMATPMMAYEAYKDTFTKNIYALRINNEDSLTETTDGTFPAIDFDDTQRIHRLHLFLPNGLNYLASLYRKDDGAVSIYKTYSMGNYEKAKQFVNVPAPQQLLALEPIAVREDKQYQLEMFLRKKGHQGLLSKINLV